MSGVTVRHRTAVTCAAALFAATAALAAPPARVSANDIAFERAAKSVAKGQKLIVDGLLLDREKGTSNLELERFEVWRADAVVMIGGRRVEAPKSVYFRGIVDGDPDSRVLLSVREKGGVQGMVFRGNGTWAIGNGKGQAGLRSKKSDSESFRKTFECGLDELPAELQAIVPDEDVPVRSPSTVYDKPYDATIAIDTDYEYYNLGAFSAPTPAERATKALDYMGDLIGYADLVYSREIDTDMRIGFARLWDGGAATDPYSNFPSCVDSNGDGVADNPPCGTSGALNEYVNYWNANMKSTQRTVAHLLSGKGLGGGIAYLGVLCQNYGPGSTSDYGLSASLGGSFNWDGNQANNPASVVWDINVVTHEIGHNFNSPHTHDYCNIGGSALPIDDCYDDGTGDGCDSGSPNVLPTCTGAPITAYTSGGGKGTIMSYCHLLTGNYGNIAMTFGEGHPCGTLPGRQADRMSAHVVSRAATYPQCFANALCGNGTIDAGEECDGGNLNGGSCSSEGFVGGTLSCTSSCTFNTSACHLCGNNQIDAGEECDGGNLNGASCGTFGCAGGSLACNSSCTAYDKSACADCPPCNDNGTCDPGEDCDGCPGDCVGGTTTGAVCGNGVCEAGNGEDCASCPSDCRGVQGGKPSGRYCCGDGGGTNAVTCADARCTSSGFSCTTVPAVPTEYCCGDAACEGAEACGNCAVDCTTSATDVCGNGIDDDCSGGTDCSDSDCSSTFACQCEPTGSACTSSSECCSGSCRTKGKNANTCA